MINTSRRIWVKSSKTDDLVWNLANIIREVDEDTLAVTDIHGYNQRTVPIQDTFPVDQSHVKFTNDICELNNIHEAPVLDYLRRRFLNGELMTFASDNLIVFHPCTKKIENDNTPPPSYWNTESFLLTNIKALKSSSSQSPTKLRPHPYAIANNVMQKFDRNRKENMKNKYSVDIDAQIVDQTIILLGESASGKSEMLRKLINFFTDMDINLNFHQKKMIVQSSCQSIINDNLIATENVLSKNTKHIIKILEETPTIFESFGNAKTICHTNATRHGHYLRFYYNLSNELVAARYDMFLFEESRLNYVHNFERNFHIFYQLVRGIHRFDSQIAATLQLQHRKVEKFRLLIQGELFFLKEVFIRYHNNVIL
jgi:myosin heavy subunit